MNRRRFLKLVALMPMVALPSPSVLPLPAKKFIQMAKDTPLRGRCAQLVYLDEANWRLVK